MTKSVDMSPFDFLLGDWHLNYEVPKSDYSPEAMRGDGKGCFEPILDGHFIRFEYVCSLLSGDGSAVGIFGWDAGAGCYRYWWFESSGAHETALCHFPDPDTLFMDWEGTDLIQTFYRDDADHVTLKMEQRGHENASSPVLRVFFERMPNPL